MTDGLEKKRRKKTAKKSEKRNRMGKIGRF
jgi:hypothetical protein